MTSVMIAKVHSHEYFTGTAGVDADLDGVEVAHEAQDTDEHGEQANDDAQRDAEHGGVTHGRHVDQAGARQENAQRVVDEEREGADARDSGERVRVTYETEAERTPASHR